MSEAVKRYSVFIGFEHGEQQMILAADHDRIVSSLTEAGVKMQAQVDQLEHELEIREEERKSLCGMIDGQNVRIAQHLEQIERLRLELERRSGPGADLKDGSDVQS